MTYWADPVWSHQAAAPYRTALAALVAAWDEWDPDEGEGRQEFLDALAAARRLIEP